MLNSRNDDDPVGMAGGGGRCWMWRDPRSLAVVSANTFQMWFIHVNLRHLGTRYCYINCKEILVIKVFSETRENLHIGPLAKPYL